MWLTIEERFENWWANKYPDTTDGKSSAWAAWKEAWDRGYGERCYEEKCAL
jgi:hypothetical protein